MKLIYPPAQPRQLPNLERAVDLLENMRVLWSHSGVTDEQRESFIRGVFKRILIDGKQITSIEPKSDYKPLFATMPLTSKYGYCGSEPPLVSTRNKTGLPDWVLRDSLKVRVADIMLISSS